MHALVLALAILTPAPDKKAPSPGMAIDDLIKKTRQRMEKDTSRVKEGLMYNQTEITEELNPDSSVASSKNELFLVYGAMHESGTLQMAKLPLEINGEQIMSQPRWMDGFIDETFFDRFRFAWADIPVTTCGEVQCYVVSFWPKDNPPHNASHKQKTFNLLMGVLQIEKGEYILRHGQARLSRPYTKIFGMGCSRLDISFEFGEYKGIQISKTYEITTQYRGELFGDEKYRHHTITNSGFRKRPSP